MHRFCLFAAMLAIAVSTGCNRAAKHDHPTFGGRKLSVLHTRSGTQPIKVVCTTGMVADLVRNIGGEQVQIEQLMGADVDPHLYKVTSDDVTKMSNADVIFYSGLHLEGKMIDAFERLARRKPVFPVGEYLDPKLILTDNHKHPDPHIWFDVSLWNEVAGVITEALCLYDPPHAADYKKRGDAYRQELTKLHDDAKREIATIDKGKRVLVTSHDAFRYFGRAYDIEVKGIQGISTEAEASVGEINQLVEFLVTRKAKAVFVETSVNQRNMDALRAGCKARGHEVALGGELFSDAMGKEGTPEGTYIGMIRHNVETIVNALK